MDQTALLKELRRDEGYKRKLYQDSVGKWTIGIGYNIDDNGLPDHIIQQLYEEHVEIACNNLHKLYPEWQTLTELRQRVLVNMSYNMGYRVFKTFKLFWKAVKAGDTEEAVKQIKASRYYSQVGIRADRLIKMWREGK